MRASLTTVLDLIGMLLIVVSFALTVWAVVPGPWGGPCALFVAGAGVLAISWIADRKAAA